MKKNVTLTSLHTGIPTVESINQGEFIVEEASTRAGDLRFRRTDTTELDRLLLRKKISPHQHQIGEEFLGILHRAQMLGVRGANWQSGGIAGGERNISERQANAFAEASRILIDLKNKGGDKVKNKILSLFLEDCPISSGSCVLLVKKGLDIVGEFFTKRYGWNPMEDLSKKKPPFPVREQGLDTK